MFLFIGIILLGSILFFQNISITGFVVGEPSIINNLSEGKNLLEGGVRTKNVIVEGLAVEIVKRSDIYALYTDKISANNLINIELYNENSRLKGQIISGVDKNIAVVGGKSYYFNLNENLVIECNNDVCLSCIKCEFNK